jgi:hypothetical protein
MTSWKLKPPEKKRMHSNILNKLFKLKNINSNKANQSQEAIYKDLSVK